MALCVYCGLGLATTDMCPHHTVGFPEDWVAQNRAACDFVHRKKLLPRDEEDFWTWQDRLLLRRFRGVA